MFDNYARDNRFKTIKIVLTFVHFELFSLYEIEAGKRLRELTNRKIEHTHTKNNSSFCRFLNFQITAIFLFVGFFSSVVFVFVFSDRVFCFVHRCQKNKMKKKIQTQNSGPINSPGVFCLSAKLIRAQLVKVLFLSITIIIIILFSSETKTVLLLPFSLSLSLTDNTKKQRPISEA